MEMLQLTKNKNSEPVIICHLSPLRTSHSIRMLKSPRSQQTQHLYFLILTDADDINVMRVVKTCVLSKDQSRAAIQCINVSLGQKDQNWTSKLSTIKVLVKIVQNAFAICSFPTPIQREGLRHLFQNVADQWNGCRQLFSSYYCVRGWARQITSFTIRNPWKSDCLSVSPFNLSCAGAWNLEESTFTFIFFALLGAERDGIIQTHCQCDWKWVFKVSFCVLQLKCQKLKKMVEIQKS